VPLQPHTFANHFKDYDAEWPVALVRAQFAVIGMISASMPALRDASSSKSCNSRLNFGIR
jgi:hypothetical protein